MNVDTTASKPAAPTSCWNNFSNEEEAEVDLRRPSIWVGLSAVVVFAGEGLILYIQFYTDDIMSYKADKDNTEEWLTIKSKIKDPKTGKIRKTEKQVRTRALQKEGICWESLEWRNRINSSKCKYVQDLGGKNNLQNKTTTKTNRSQNKETQKNDMNQDTEVQNHEKHLEYKYPSLEPKKIANFLCDY